MNVWFQVSFVVDSPSPVLGEPAVCPPPASPALPLSPHGMCPNPRDKFYCRRSIVHQTDRLNNSILDCSVTFTVDRNICVIGIQVRLCYFSKCLCVLPSRNKAIDKQPLTD